MSATRRLCWLWVPLAISVGCASSGGQAAARLKTFDEGMQPEELVKRARAYAQIGDFTRAEEYYAAAIQNGGDRRELMPPLLDACLRDGRYRLATEHATEHLRVFPTDYRTRFVLGTLYIALEDWTHAEQQLSRVVREQPELASAHFALGTALKPLEGQRLRADQHFREYLRLAPEGENAAQAREQLLDLVPESGDAPAPTGQTTPAPPPAPSSAPVDPGAPTQVPHPPLMTP